MAVLQMDTRVNIIAAGALFITMGGIWADQRSQMAIMSTQIQVQGQAIVAVNVLIHDRGQMRDADSAAKEGEIRALQINEASLGSDLRNIQSGVSRIENAVEAISRKVGP